MKKKVISCLLIAAMVSSLAAGCGSSNDKAADKTDEDGKVTITIGGWPTKDNEQYEIYQGYLETMNEMYPDRLFLMSISIQRIPSFQRPRAGSFRICT